MREASVIPEQVPSKRPWMRVVSARQAQGVAEGLEGTWMRRRTAGCGCGGGAPGHADAAAWMDAARSLDGDWNRDGCGSCVCVCVEFCVWVTCKAAPQVSKGN